MDTIPITSALYSAKQPLHRKLPKTGNWGPAEDARLRQAVSKYGFRWILVADEVGTRNGDQCAKRWKDNLDPQLDHSQWSPDEEERLLNLVEIYGHNWKFIAQHFFQSRAPLSLKNRNSLLMRRLKRQATEHLRNRQKQEQTSSIDGCERRCPTPARSGLSAAMASPSASSSVSVSPLPTSPSSAADIASFYDEGTRCRGSRQPGEAGSAQPTIMGASDFTPWGTAPFTTVRSLPDSEISPSHVRQGGQSSIMSISPSAWDDENLSWSRKFDPAAAAELDTAENDSEFNLGGVIPITPGNNAEIDTKQHGDLGIGGRGPLNANANGPIAGPQEAGDSGSGQAAPAAVKYSVTCRRGKAQTIVNLLMEAAISEIAERAGEDENVTINLRIDV